MIAQLLGRLCACARAITEVDPDGEVTCVLCGRPVDRPQVEPAEAETGRAR